MALEEALAGLEAHAAYIARVAAVLLAGLVVSYMARRMVARITYTIMPRDTAALATKAVFYTLLFLTALAALSAAGVNLTALAIAGGFTSLVASLALQPILSNFFSGLYLFTEKSVAPGDVVSVGGYTGRVLEVSTMSTKLVSLDGFIVRIPNSRVIDDVLVNYTKTPVRRLTFKASVAYREDAERAVEVIKREIEEIYLVLDNPAPEVYVSELGSSGVDITVRVWVPSSHWYEASWEVLARVKRALQEAGIEIPFNQVDIWLRTPVRLEGGLVAGGED